MHLCVRVCMFECTACICVCTLYAHACACTHTHVHLCVLACSCVSTPYAFVHAGIVHVCASMCMHTSTCVHCVCSRALCIHNPFIPEEIS